MDQTSKTLVNALSELLIGLEQDKQVTISNLANQLACDLDRIYETYLPYGKMLKVTIIKQKGTTLYSATCELVDNNA